MHQTLEAAFCIAAAQEALAIAAPEISNSDQGVQFTSVDYRSLWQAYDVKISMDHRGRCFDNIFTERLWRSVKYEEVYLKSYETILEAKEGIGQYFDFYNNRRLHQSLDYRTPQRSIGKGGENISRENTFTVLTMGSTLKSTGDGLKSKGFEAKY